MEKSQQPLVERLLEFDSCDLFHRCCSAIASTNICIGFVQSCLLFLSASSNAFIAPIFLPVYFQSSSICLCISQRLIVWTYQTMSLRVFLQCEVPTVVKSMYLASPGSSQVTSPSSYFRKQRFQFCDWSNIFLNHFFRHDIHLSGRASPFFL